MTEFHAVPSPRCVDAGGGGGVMRGTAAALPDDLILSLADGRKSDGWVKLMPVGDIEAVDGRRWTLADPDAVVRASHPTGIDLVVDCDHQSDRAANSGGQAPAAGWIKELTHRDGFLLGRIEWTASGAARLKAREYRYISPTFLFDKARRVVRILRAALTNTPAIHELTALASMEAEGPDLSDPHVIAALATEYMDAQRKLGFRITCADAVHRIVTGTA